MIRFFGWFVGTWAVLIVFLFVIMWMSTGIVLTNMLPFAAILCICPAVMIAAHQCSDIRH